ncbi:MAG: TetR/AcrR family transcriptional regulator [Spirochaetota bacterium]
MGRQKKYNRQDIIKKATDLFHQYGFKPSGTKEIVEAVGINKFSLYAEFASNKVLFLECLEYYYSFALEESYATLEQESSDIESIILFFEKLPQRARNPQRRGCLLCNTAMEFSNRDEEINPILNKYFKRVHTSFQNALQNSIDKDLLLEEVDTNSIANYLTTTMVGIMGNNRAKLPAKQVADTCTHIIHFLRLLQKRTTVR